MVERDEHGRVKPGSVLNPRGRQPREKEHEYLTDMLSIVTPKHWRAIVTKAVEQAERGDAVARKWLADYIVGEPEKNMNIDSVITWVDGED